MRLTDSVSAGGSNGGITLSATSVIGVASTRIQRDFHRVTEEVAGRAFPVLAFPLIHVQPEGLAIGARERRVDVDERLHPVVAGGNVLETGDWMASFGHGQRDRGSCP